MASIVGPLSSTSLNVNIFDSDMRCLSGELLLADMTDKTRLLNPVTWPSIVGPLIITYVNVNIIHTQMRGCSGELLIADITDTSRMMLYPMTWLSIVGPLNTSLEPYLNS